MTEKHPLEACGLKYSTLPDIPLPQFEDLEKALSPDTPDLPLTPVEKYPVTEYEISKALLVLKEALEDKEYYNKWNFLISNTIDSMMIPNRVNSGVQEVVIPEDNINILAKNIATVILKRIIEL